VGPTVPIVRASSAIDDFAQFIGRMDRAKALNPARLSFEAKRT
jgi:hypothetical protein